MSRPIVILDGPLGTELASRGVPTPLPGWSAHALESHPGAVAAIHRDYVTAGARVTTTNTFRTRRRTFPHDWERLARKAVALARETSVDGVRVAGSLAPLEDCYTPAASPVHTDAEACRREHRELAEVLADSGCDLLLCETFPLVAEGLVATEEALRTGLETWISFTPGPDADLLTPDEVAAGARRALDLGASAVLVNCVPARRAAEFVARLAAVAGPSPFGCYANAGHVDDRMGWTSVPEAPERYLEVAREWVEVGATLIGGCCGTGVPHVEALGQLGEPGPA